MMTLLQQQQRYNTMVLIKIHPEKSSFYQENGRGPRLLVVAGVKKEEAAAKEKHHGKSC